MDNEKKNILFLTLLDFNSFSERNIYCDLLREFIKNGHDVYCISPVENRHKVETHFEENGRLLKLKIGNTQKTNVIEKGISTITLERKFVNAIKTFFSDVKFDLILYSTPPITLQGAIRYVKERDGAKTYLLLKDIFPQNAVDLKMLSKVGIKAPIYYYFRKKEKRLYKISDKIGCMSQANVDYILSHNRFLDSRNVEVCPNCIEVRPINITDREKFTVRNKYNLPQEKTIFIYGGNLGKPQDIPFIIDCLKSQKDNKNAFFLIVGDGTDYNKLKRYIDESLQENVRLMQRLPQEEFDYLVASCDVGMIFLDHRFTIPNFPSRLLSYMQAGLPVLACTDTNTDVGKTIVDNGFGWWCESNDIRKFDKIVKECTNFDFSCMKIMEEKILEDQFSVYSVYKILEKI